MTNVDMTSYAANVTSRMTCWVALGSLGQTFHDLMLCKERRVRGSALDNERVALLSHASQTRSMVAKVGDAENDLTEDQWNQVQSVRRKSQELLGKIEADGDKRQSEVRQQVLAMLKKRELESTVGSKRPADNESDEDEIDSTPSKRQRLESWPFEHLEPDSK